MLILSLISVASTQKKVMFLFHNS